MSSSWEDVGVEVASMVLATFSMLDKPENVFLITFTGAPCFPISAITSPNSPTVEASFCRIPATLSTLDDGIFNAGSAATGGYSFKRIPSTGSSALFWKVDELTEEVVDMSWKELENYIDCGLFVMRYMETYKGTLKKWNPGFRKKASLNEDFLIGLRARYAATIIRWRANTLKNIVIKKTKLLYNKK
nr:uncharacterized protein LOC109158392 [Ipomoea batatas]